MFLKNKHNIALILLVLFIGTFVRFYQLGKVPNGLTVDEADLGYNSYSILKTKKDVYGRKYPLFFQSFGEFKPGLPFYSSIPAIAAFGLNDLSIRLLPAILGSLLPILIFIAARQL